MGHWNYRIMKRLDEDGQFHFGIYEAFYNDDGKVISWTKDSLTPTCSSEEDLKYEIQTMLSAFNEETLVYTEN